MLEESGRDFCKSPARFPGPLQAGTRQCVCAVHTSRMKPAQVVSGASGYCSQLPGYSELGHNSLLGALC